MATLAILWGGIGVGTMGVDHVRARLHAWHVSHILLTSKANDLASDESAHAALFLMDFQNLCDGVLFVKQQFLM